MAEQTDFRLFGGEDEAEERKLQELFRSMGGREEARAPASEPQGTPTPEAPDQSFDVEMPTGGDPEVFRSRITREVEGRLRGAHRELVLSTLQNGGNVSEILAYLRARDGNPVLLDQLLVGDLKDQALADAMIDPFRRYFGGRESSSDRVLHDIQSNRDISRPRAAFQQMAQTFLGTVYGLPATGYDLTTRGINKVLGTEIEPLRDNLEEALRQVVPSNPDYWFQNMLVGGATSASLFALASLAGAGSLVSTFGSARKAALVTSGMLGVGMGLDEGNRGILERELSGQDVSNWTVGVLLTGHGLLGASEAVPFVNWMGRVSRAGGGKYLGGLVEKLLKRTLQPGGLRMGATVVNQAVEEAAQEYGQGLFAPVVDLLADTGLNEEFRLRLFDALQQGNREGAWGALVGALIGGAFGAVPAVMEGMSLREVGGLSRTQRAELVKELNAQVKASPEAAKAAIVARMMPEEGERGFESEEEARAALEGALRSPEERAEIEKLFPAIKPALDALVEAEEAQEEEPLTEVPPGAPTDVDQESRERIRSGEQQGEEAEQGPPIAESRGEEAPAGGVLQASKEVDPAPAPKRKRSEIQREIDTKLEEKKLSRSAGNALFTLAQEGETEARDRLGPELTALLQERRDFFTSKEAKPPLPPDLQTLLNDVKTKPRPLTPEEAERISQFARDAGIGAKQKPPKGEFVLSDRLSRAKPKLGKVSLSFETDLDKALYIVGRAKESGSDAPFIAALRKFTGLDFDVVRALGLEARNRIKAVVGGAKEGSVTVPPLGILREVRAPRRPPHLSEAEFEALSTEAKKFLGAAGVIARGSRKPGGQGIVFSPAQGFHALGDLLARVAQRSGVEPRKIVERLHGRELAARIVRTAFLPESRVAKLEVRELEELGGLTAGQLRRYLLQFSESDLETFKLIQGDPPTKKGQAVKAEALQHLAPDHPLRDPKILAAIQKLRDFNFALAALASDNTPRWAADYWNGLYTDEKAAKSFYNSFYRTHLGFLKAKRFLTYADAVGAGLKHKYVNPVDNLLWETRKATERFAMRELQLDMVQAGEGDYIVREKDAKEWQKERWKTVPDPTFAGYLLDPDVAWLMENLIRINQVTHSKFLNTLRESSAFVRNVKLFTPTFHHWTMIKQAIVNGGRYGLLDPRNWRDAVSLGFKKDDPRFKDPLYIRLLEAGGGNISTLERTSTDQWSRVMDWLDGKGLVGKAVATPFKPIRFYTSQLFDQIIPQLKFLKFAREVQQKEARLGRPLTSAEDQEIVIELQNFYGEMNERLFGRSGTMTSLLRLFFLAPGFREGNFRTMWKALFQWRDGRGWRSRQNIPMSLLFTAAIASVASRILNGEWPEEPETLEQLRDLYQVKTGVKDARDRDIYIDLLNYDKDYWEVMVLPVLEATFGQDVGKGLETSFTNFRKTTRNMTAPLFGQAVAMVNAFLTGQAVEDWKGDRLWHPTDPLVRKLFALGKDVVGQFQPIPVAAAWTEVNVRDGNHMLAVMSGIFGLRTARSEREKEKWEVGRKVWDLRDKQEELYRELGRIDAPREVIREYNADVKRILESEILTPELQRALRRSPIEIDEKRLLSNKAVVFSGALTAHRDQVEIDRALDYLGNFGVATRSDLRRLLLEAARRKAISLDSVPERLARSIRRLNRENPDAVRRDAVGVGAAP